MVGFYREAEGKTHPIGWGGDQGLRAISRQEGAIDEDSQPGKEPQAGQSGFKG